MKSPAARAAIAFVFIALANCNSFAQTFAPTPKTQPSPTVDLQTLAKKLDEQNAKIDMLSQQILKLQQQMTEHRPGVMIGEGSATTSTSTSPTSAAAMSPAQSADASAKAANGNSHIVARGETLTSIAKMYNVSVSDLQKFNHIDNPLKLQAGQTLLIPPSPIPSPSSSGE
jgi:LysM repeat protein